MASEKITIKQIAEMAGVSIATVSHVINRTRYVSPELEKKVARIMRETGYADKVMEKERKLKVGRKSEIIAVLPDINSAIYRDMVSCLRELVTAQGYQFYVAVTGNDRQEEQQVLMGLIADKKVAGILQVFAGETASEYKKLMESGVPFVCLERNILGKAMDTVEFCDREGMYKGTDYLLNCGHKDILLLRGAASSIIRDERTRGFMEALKRHGRDINDAKVVDVDVVNEEKGCLTIQRALDRTAPTAVIASGNRLTLYLIKTIRNLGIECPEKLSVIGFGDESWNELIDPPLTILKRDVKGFCRQAAAMLFEKINTGKVITEPKYADVELIVRKSVKMLENGPGGEEAASPDSIVLTREEKKRLRKGHYRVAISFHYMGTAWAELHEKGIRDELERYGIDVISVMDAHFDSKLQNTQLEGIKLQQPDAVIAIPADDKETSDKFMELSKITKLVFLSNIPESLEKNHYVSCVSVNEWENGTNAGRMMGEYFKEKPSVKAGFLIHGASFYGTGVRDGAAVKVVQENYKNIEIMVVRGFGQIENTYRLCREIMSAYPEVEALYVSWDRPALLAIKALKEMGREDVAVFTTDLDYEIAMRMEEGIVRGLSTQRPYEQGQAVALVAAKSLVSEGLPKYVGVQPYVVEGKELRHAWKDIFHEPMPERVK